MKKTTASVVAAVADRGPASTTPGYGFGAADSASFWKCGSFRSGSNIGSSWSKRGSKRHIQWPTGHSPAIEIVSVGSNGAIGFPHARRHSSEDFERGGSKQSVFLDGHRANWRVQREPTRRLCHRTHIGQREIANEDKFSGCSLRKGSSSLRACRQLSWRRHGRRPLLAPSLTKKRSSPLK